jgi:hypothetical protein
MNNDDFLFSSSKKDVIKEPSQQASQLEAGMSVADCDLHRGHPSKMSLKELVDS